MAVATWQQVAVALGRPVSSFTTDQQAQITWWLDGIELLIVDRLGPAAALDQAKVTFVEVQAAAAKVPPPGTRGGESSVTVAVDDGTVTRRYENPVTVEDITDEWWALLSPVADSDAFTIRPGRVPARALDAEC